MTTPSPDPQPSTGWLTLIGLVVFAALALLAFWKPIWEALF